MIIDFHVHLFPPEMIAHRERFFDDAHFAALYKTEKSKMVNRNELLAMMRREGIKRAVAMAFPFENDEYRTLQNEYLLESSRETGGTIIPFLVAPDDAESLREWTADAKKRGAAGIGEVAFYATGFGKREQQYLAALLHAASIAELPVCLHVNEPVGHRYPGKYASSIELLYEAIAQYPNAKIILAHWGGGIFFYELMKEVREALSHVWYDTAATPYLYDENIYKIAGEIIGAEKILFGSDYPLISPARYIQAMRRYFYDEELTHVLGANAQKLLGIP